MVNITYIVKKIFSNFLIFVYIKYYLPYIHFLSGNYSGKYTMQVRIWVHTHTHNIVFLIMILKLSFMFKWKIYSFIW